MGQEQSFNGYTNAPVKRYSEKYADPIHYRVARVDYPINDRDEKDYRRNRNRRSADSRSDNSSSESSGYRSGSSAYDCHSDTSYKSDYYRTSLYKNDHYRDINKDLYRPVKIPKDKYKVILFGNTEIESSRLKGYLSDRENVKLKSVTPMKTGIRNYTPKIIAEQDIQN